MEFLKSAVVSAISKGPPFPYNFGERVNLDFGIWTLFNGTKREDGSKCSIFSFNISASKHLLPLARNSVKKLRTIRHPKVIKLLDTLENDSHIHIVVEQVVPLSWYIKTKTISIETIKWGLFSVAQTIKFINGDAVSIHGALKLDSVFISESGEWKVGGFELLSCFKDDDAIIYSHGCLLPDNARRAPPELSKSGWDLIKKNPPTAVDAYSFGLLISEVFDNYNSRDTQAAHTTKIPASMQASYRRLMNDNPKARISVGDFFDQGSRKGGYFVTPLIKLTETIEQLGMKSEQEKEEFLNDLDRFSDDFPEEYFKTKVLPELLKCIEFGGGGPKFLDVVMKISRKLSKEDFEKRILPAIIKLFGFPDRAIRVCLLDGLPLMVERIPPKIINDKIFTQMVTGLTDTSPVVREETIKAVLTIIDQLSDKTKNSELLKYLAKTSNDEQPGIRTNTIICLGKISKNLDARTRTKVLIAAFTRSLKDPFVHARNAALMALAVTSDFFSEDDSASRILPAICPCLIDKEKIIRDQANKTIDIYLNRLRKFAATMPDTILPSSTTDSHDIVPKINVPQTSDAAFWTSWPISSFANKVSGMAGDIIQNNTSSDSRMRSLSTTPIENKKPLSTNPTSLSETPNSSKYNINSATLTVDHFKSSNRQDSVSVDDSWDSNDKFFDYPSGISTVTENGTKNSHNQEEEPDFAGWLAAQSGQKLRAKPLPKGLVRPPAASKLNSNNPIRSTGLKKSLANKSAPNVSSAKKIDTSPNENEEYDGWGESW
ncbi:N-terminal kinase-like protein [Golovinomyces cichoracearum]|uniref:N-terminal kinase-like protein n=1 Tax=Golovinomyces cichoracearum TaxID=62708 RepID=A0A420JAE2_9PEZI|nr:N-terminal kinase-like protein [Golovinomyces cichoracearum]